MSRASDGPLGGLRVLEVGGIGPVPHAGMVLADLGADIVRVERPGGRGPLDLPVEGDPLMRGKRVVTLDLKAQAGQAAVRRLAGLADVLLEGFRPGVMERLGLGPDPLRHDNPRLVYARVTGWGHGGAWSSSPGHDINYLSVSGVLSAIGVRGADPVPPLNLVGDYAAGSFIAVIGILAALVERARTGTGRAIDAAMVDGISVLAQHLWSMVAAGDWKDGPGASLLGGACPFYRTYRTLDGQHVAVGAMEPKFFARLVEGTGIEYPLEAQLDEAHWPDLAREFEQAFASRPLDHWVDTFPFGDACVTPVLTPGDAADHLAVRDRGTVVEVDGIPIARSAPRFDGHHARDVQPPATVIEADAAVAGWS